MPKEDNIDNAIKLLGAGKNGNISPVNFSDLNRKKTCLEVDFPIVPINSIAALEATTGALKRPIYQMSKWWARRPSGVFRAIMISALCEAPEDDGSAASKAWDNYFKDHSSNTSLSKIRIADIFMGGGTTIVEASRLGVESFGNDLNPIAWLIVKNETASINKSEVEKLLGHIESTVRPAIAPFYASDGPLGEKGQWIDLRTQTVLPETFVPWEVPVEERKNYSYKGPELAFTFWCKHGVSNALGVNWVTPVLSSNIFATKEIGVKYWRQKCEETGKEFDVELAPNRLCPDAPIVFAEGEVPSVTINERGEFSSPFTGKVYCDRAASMRGESVAMGGKAKTKKVIASLLVGPGWMSGGEGVTSNSKGGGKSTTLNELFAWYKTRCGNIDIIEIRGETKGEIVCPKTGKAIPVGADAGTVPKGAHFLCGKTGRLIPVIESIRYYQAKLPVAPYASLVVGSKYSGREDGKVFLPFVNLAQLVAAEEEWYKRKETDLREFCPTTKIPEGFNTNQAREHGYEGWEDMFNARQLLVHAQILKAVATASGYSQAAKDFVLGALMQYLRCNNMFSIWHVQNNQISAFFSNNNYHPKMSTVEAGVFNKVGDGTWASAVRGLMDGLDWKESPWDILPVSEYAKLDPVSAKSVVSKCLKIPMPDRPVDNCKVSCMSSTDYRACNDGSVDLVITDPPFSGLLNYAEYSEFFYAWMRLVLKDHYPDVFGGLYVPKAQEAVSNPVRNPEDPDAHYKNLLTACWREANRILRPAGILAFTFHHKDDEPWVDVLESLFDAGFYLEATYPIRGDEIKGSGQFGSKLIEYDIIHVCRKRFSQPSRISWARLRRKIMDDVRQLKDLLVRHQTGGLPEADLRVIKRGKALEYYSQHYGQVFVEQGREFTLHEALVGINQLIDDEEEQSSDAPPVTAEAFSRQFLRIFRKADVVPNDQLQKTLRGTGMSPADFEKRGWCEKDGKVFRMVDPMAWAREWKGQNRKGMARDLDQTLFLIGASYADSGINVWDTLNSSTFRHHPAIPDLLPWFVKNGASQTVKEAAFRAQRLYEDWMERNKPAVQAVQAEFGFTEEVA